MQEITIGDGKFFQCISFHNSNSQAKMGSLHINNMNNIEVRYEFFTQIDMEDKVTLDRKVGSLQDAILNVKQG